MRLRAKAAKKAWLPTPKARVPVAFGLAIDDHSNRDDRKAQSLLNKLAKEAISIPKSRKKAGRDGVEGMKRSRRIQGGGPVWGVYDTRPARTLVHESTSCHCCGTRARGASETRPEQCPSYAAAQS